MKFGIFYAHQNEGIVRLTPEELKRKMAAKEARHVGAGATAPTEAGAPGPG